MATDKTTLRNWFKTGLKPTQAQFWAWMDSYWHKDEKIAISNIENLGNILDVKADNNHTHTQYATNDASSLTAENVTAWQNALGVDDLNYVEIPTTDATAESHPYVVVIDAEGNSAKRNATDFGKVDTIDGIEADDEKDVKLGAVRKTESNEVLPSFDFHQANGAYVSIDADGVKVSKGGIYSLYKPESIKPFNQVPGAAYQFQELLFPKRTATGTEEKVYHITYVNGVKANENGKADIWGVANNWTSASQRFSGLTDKSADATYNLFPVFDSNKNLAYADNPYQLFKKGFGLLSAQQALELGHLLNGGQGSAGAMSVNLISPPFIQNFYNSIEYVVLRGANLYLNSESMGVEILASDKTTIVASIPNSQIQLNSNGTELIFYYNFHNFPLGTYYIKLISGTRIYISTISFGVKEKVDEVNVNSIVWEKTERNDIAISTNNMASSGDFIIATDDVDQNTPLPIISFKSNELFPEGQDFMIDMELTFSNTTWGESSNASKASIGIGYSVDTNELSYRNVADVKMLCFQSIGIDIKNDNTTVYYDVGPVTFRFTIVKTGNLIRQTLGSHTTTKTINNNSGYSIFLQMPGFDKSTYIQGRILKLYKF